MHIHRETFSRESGDALPGASAFPVLPADTMQQLVASGRSAFGESFPVRFLAMSQP